MAVDEKEISEKFNILVENLRKIYGLSYHEILELTSKIVDKTDISIPLSIFKDRRLGVLESLTLHLKDEIDMSFAQIARALDRDNRTIWATYHKAKKKVGTK